MSDEKHEHTDIRFLAGFFIGGLIGALVIFFLGTKDGKKIGNLLEGKGKDILDDLEGQLEELEKKGKEIVKDGEKIKDQVVEQMEEKKEELTGKAAEKLNDALSKIEEVQEKGLHTTVSIRKRIFKNAPKRK